MPRLNKKLLRNVLLGTIIIAIIHFLSEHRKRVREHLLQLGMSSTNFNKQEGEIRVHITENSQNNKPHMFKILYWNKDKDRGPDSPIDWFGLGTEPFERCEFKNCLMTNNKADYNSSDAVLIKMPLTEEEEEVGLPLYKPPGQKWIARWHESPANRNFSQFNGLINATWTYSRKSDIYTHIYLKRFVSLTEHGGGRAYLTSKDIELSPDVFRRKTKMAAWFVSRCNSQSRREDLVKALQEHIDIDIYGKCGPLRCGHDRRKSEPCDQMLATDYKFYLSFENSLCSEYVTEKLWRAYENDIIPVVMGAFDYSAYLPEHSYIDVSGFSSVRELADYLVLVGNNEGLYLEYLQWKTRYKLENYGLSRCEVCKYLHQTANTTKVYQDLGKFWDKSRNCTEPKVFYKDLFAGL